MRDLPRLARVIAAAVALAAMTACMGTEKSVVEATGVPVGGGVNVPAGSNEDFIVNVGRRVYFAANSAELDEVAKVTLQKQADWLARHSAYKIKIEGFADDGGGAESNKTLGLKRCEPTSARSAWLPPACARRRSGTSRSVSCIIATTSPAVPRIAGS